MTKTVYYVETPDEIWYSTDKIDAIYKHIEYLYRDKAKYKEVPSGTFKKIRANTPKKVYEIHD